MPGVVAGGVVLIRFSARYVIVIIINSFSSIVLDAVITNLEVSALILIASLQERLVYEVNKCAVLRNSAV